MGHHGKGHAVPFSHTVSQSVRHHRLPTPPFWCQRRLPARWKRRAGWRWRKGECTPAVGAWTVSCTSTVTLDRDSHGGNCRGQRRDSLRVVAGGDRMWLPVVSMPLPFTLLPQDIQ